MKEQTSVELYPSVTWETEVVQTKYLDPETAVSYGWTYQASEREKVAVIPIGYADGYLRSMSGAYVEVGGKQCQVIGRVCMDQTIIRVPDDVEIGDKVILMTEDGDDAQSVEALAQQQQTINYEVLCNLSRRLPRLYQYEDHTRINNELLK